MGYQGGTSTKQEYYGSVLMFAIVSTVTVLSSIGLSVSLAQVTPITSSGLNTQVSSPHTLASGKVQYDITGGTRPGGGTNLFHSFGNFNVPSNNIANFLNDSALPTSNILGRVTGGNVSNIFGMIQTNGPGGFGNANLFLVNPAGFLFGPNATLNVGGMVAFSSADYLRLADGTLFNAIPNPSADAVLSAAPVAAFGFLGTNPGAITIQGSQLSVAPAQSLSLIGGNITIQSGTLDNGTVQPARLSAPNGQINLASAASPGEFLWESMRAGGFVEFQTPFGPVTQFIGQSLAGPNINGEAFSSFANVHLTPGSTIDTSHAGDGNVSIMGGELVVNIQNAVLSTADIAAPSRSATNSVVISPGSTIYSLTSAGEHGPDVEIVADRIAISGTPILPPTFPTPALIITETSGSGPAGNIRLTATHNIELFDAAVVSLAFGPPTTGPTGNIDILTREGNISLTSQSQINSQGNIVGTLSLNAPHGDILLDSSLVNTIIGGNEPLAENAGGIQISANNLTLRNSLGLNGSTIEGDNFTNPQVPGNITITLSGDLNIDGGSSIQTISRGPAAAAADLNISARNISVTGSGMNFDQVINSQINTETISSGTGGQLALVADSLQLTNGGQLRSGSVIGRDPLTGEPTNPSGRGGTINIQGSSGPIASVLIDGAGSGIFTNAEGTGAGGNMIINANAIMIQNGGTLSAATTGTASTATGGSINVNAQNGVTMNSGGSISASSTGPGNAGNIFVNAGAQLLMQDSSIKTEAAQAGGGNIEIQAGNLVQLGNSTVSTSVLGGSGSGGNITIDPNAVVLQNSQILAQAVQGSGGNISITTNLLLPDSTSIISASSQFGQQGNIVIQSPVSPASGKIIPLGQKPLLATTLLGQRCAALAGGNISSFTVAGRDALPTEPGALLSNPLPLQLAELSDDGAKESISTNTTDAGEATPLLSLRRIAPPGFLTQSFASDVAGCAS